MEQFVASSYFEIMKQHKGRQNKIEVRLRFANARIHHDAKPKKEISFRVNTASRHIYVSVRAKWDP